MRFLIRELSNMALLLNSWIFEWEKGRLDIDLLSKTLKESFKSWEHLDSMISEVCFLIMVISEG